MPGPLRASPPLTFQVTSAPSSAGRLVRNCSTGVPCLPDTLQPVQLVSMTLVPGEMEKLVPAESAATIPPAQPATASRTAGRKKAANRSGHWLTAPWPTEPERKRHSADARTKRRGPAEMCPQSSKIRFFLNAPSAFYSLDAPWLFYTPIQTPGFAKRDGLRRCFCVNSHPGSRWVLSRIDRPCGLFDSLARL